jgi:hypothetical protein
VKVTARIAIRSAAAVSAYNATAPRPANAGARSSQPRLGEVNAMTRLDKPLKREVTIKGKPHVLTVDPRGLKLTQKGRRKGVEIKWIDLASGEAALAVALNASLGSLNG